MEQVDGLSGGAVANLLAAIAGALSGPPAVGLLVRAAGPLTRAGDRIVTGAAVEIRSTLAPLRRAGSHGRDPSGRERLRLALGGAIAAGCAGWVLGGRGLALAASVAAAVGVPRAATARRARYGRRVEAGAAAAALSIAGALAGGGSIRAAVSAAAGELHGPIAIELQRAAVQIEAGASVDAALDALVGRAPSRSIALISAAVQLQRRSGGDLAALLRQIAASLEDEQRAAADAGAATAQARMTSVMVIALPPAGLVFAELASPGLVGRMLGSPAGASLLTVAFGLQVVGAVAVRRLARVE